MKLMASLANEYVVSDYISMEVNSVAVGNDEISSRHHVSLSFDTIANLATQIDTFVMLNQLYFEQELPLVEKWLENLSKTEVKGIIFQDFAILNLVSKMEWQPILMYCPETLNTNSQTLNDLESFGINSAFLAREISLDDVLTIASKTHVPLMIQAHGVMYMAQSRRPLLSNYAKSEEIELTEPYYLMTVNDSSMKAYIHEDHYGTHVQTFEELCALDILGQLSQAGISYIYVDTQYMNESYALEIVNIYADALKFIENGTFTKNVHELHKLLNGIKENHEYSDGFYFDSTVYKIEDVRRLDNEKKNQ